MAHPTTRREFLSHASALSLAAGAGALLGSADSCKAQDAKAAQVNDNAKIPIIDTHQHLWNLEKFNLPWTKVQRFQYSTAVI